MRKMYSEEQVKRLLGAQLVASGEYDNANERYVLDNELSEGKIYIITHISDDAVCSKTFTLSTLNESGVVSDFQTSVDGSESPAFYEWRNYESLYLYAFNGDWNITESLVYVYEVGNLGNASTTVITQGGGGSSVNRKVWSNLSYTPEQDLLRINVTEEMKTAIQDADVCNVRVLSKGSYTYTCIPCRIYDDTYCGCASFYTDTCFSTEFSGILMLAGDISDNFITLVGITASSDYETWNDNPQLSIEIECIKY